MRVVIDTNVLLSALMSSASSPAQVLAFWRSRKFDLVTSIEQLDEIARVTRYPKIRARLRAALAGRLVNPSRPRHRHRKTPEGRDLSRPRRQLPPRARRCRTCPIPGHRRQAAPRPKAPQIHPHRHSQRPDLASKRLAKQKKPRQSGAPTGNPNHFKFGSNKNAKPARLQKNPLVSATHKLANLLSPLPNNAARNAPAESKNPTLGNRR